MVAFLAALPGLLQAAGPAASALRGGGSTKVSTSQSQSSSVAASVSPLIQVNAGQGGIAPATGAGSVYGGASSASASAPITTPTGRASLDIPYVTQPVSAYKVAAASAGGLDVAGFVKSNPLAAAALVGVVAFLVWPKKGKGRK
jgi:hypothetical protein